MNKKDFGDDFHWGVSTAAYQIEGAVSVDGKGESIWDIFTKKKNKIFDKHTGDVACDFYNKYAQDIYLVYQLKIPNFRFSLSWSRILPQGTGQINQKGIDFYNRVINLCLELGIEPWITLYHWDLPQTLQNKGGWTNREIVDWFTEYVSCCVSHFGDRVTKWIVLNEPMVFTGAGYFLGVHAPGEKGISNFIAAAHHATLSQAIGARTIKSIQSDSKVGTTFSHSYIEPYDFDDFNDHKATKKVDALLNRLFIEPLLGMGYPIKDLTILDRIEKHIKSDDMNLIHFDMDFIGLQVYTRELVKFSRFTPFLQAAIVKASNRCVHHTIMNWEVHPKCIYKAIKKFDTYKNIKELIITENGAAFDDVMYDNKIHDQLRVDYLKSHLKELLKAKKEGSNVNGYFVWTLVDNFEWAEGFKPRFGLVYLDHLSQDRIIKDSGIWYRDFIS